MIKRLLLVASAALLLGGCNDDGDVTPPAAPRGFYSVTGDHTVYLHWLGNTEGDLAGYRIYQSDCANGPSCPYKAIGLTTGTSFTVTGLANGVTKYFAVAAYDRSGNESDLTYEDVFDTPRPEGTGAVLASYLSQPSAAGWDFSAYSVRASDDPATDMYFGYNGTTYLMFVPDYATEIQDAGYASTLDAVDFAPTGGWSPTGTVELIEGHCYVVWTRDDHYAKFQVTSISAPGPSAPAQVHFDWAYQVDTGNRELRMRPVKKTGPRPITWEKPPA